MVARHEGYSVSAATIIKNTPTDTKGKRKETKKVEVVKEVEKINEETGEKEIVKEVTYKEVTDWYGGNPFKVFVGHPTKGLSTGSYRMLCSTTCNSD